MSVASGSTNPCAWPLGPFEQTNVDCTAQDQFECVSCALDQRRAIGGDAKPAGLGFIPFQLIFIPRVPAITTNPKLVALVVIKKIIYGT